MERRLKSLLFITLTCVIGALAQPSTRNVMDFGAIGDGKTDDTKAFLATWNATCQSTGDSEFHVPGGKTFLLSRIKFAGPCKSQMISLRVDGNILRPSQVWADVPQWIMFLKINGLTVDGSGQFDAQGSASWPCLIEHKCKYLARTLMLSHVSNVVLSGLTFINSAEKHISVGWSKHVVIQNLHIRAPADSPNTDGIYISKSQNVQIKNCTIGTGDDCIAIDGGTVNINVSDVTCGPGHGISIGSLGKGNKEDKVEQIRVWDSRITGTTNGVRIKTWQGGSGYAKGILFQNINFTSVWNPIVIDQFYCPHQACSSQESAVKVSDVQYIGITGMTLSDVAINLNCSQSVACEGIVLDGVDILPDNEQGRKPAAAAYCHNAHGIKRGVIVPDVPCLNLT